MMNELHRAARTLAAKGLAVLPCVAGGKEPAVPGGVYDATTDAKIIDEWWQLLPDANVAVACGAISGIFAIDVDGPEGEETIRKLEERFDPLPPSIECVTGGGGRHVYYRLGEHRVPKNTVGKIGPHVDTRSDGGFCVVPPSIHSTGRRYEWSVDSASEFKDAPDWIHALMVEVDEAKAKPVEEWRAIASGVVEEGRRNDTLARLSGHLLRHHIDPYVALDLVRAFNATRCQPALADEEVVSVVNSIARREAERRYG